MRILYQQTPASQSCRFRADRFGGSLYGVAILIVFLFLLFAVFLPQFFRMREGVYRISCKEIRAKVRVAISDYNINNPRSIVQAGQNIDLDALKASGFLHEIQRCPEGGKFIFGKTEDVTCSIHTSTDSGISSESAKPPADASGKTPNSEGEK